MGSTLKSRIASASALSLLDQCLKVASALIVSPAIIRALGVDGYGVWVLAVSIAGYVDLLDLGFSMATVRFCSRAIGAGDDSTLAALFAFLTRHYRNLGLAVIAVGTGCLAVQFLVYGPPDTHDLLPMVGILAVVNGLAFSFRAHAALLKARLEYGKVIGAGLTRVALFTIVVVAWPQHGLTLWSVLLVQAMLQIAEALLLYAWARRSAPAASTAGRLCRETRRDFMKFSRDMALGGLTVMLRQRLDTQLLGAYTSPAAVSHYAIGSRLPQMFFDMVNAFFGGHLMVGFSQLAARRDEHDRANLHGKLFRMLRLSTAVSVTGTVGLCVFGPPFLQLWVGPEFTASHPVLQALAIGTGLTAFHYPMFSYFGAINAYGKMVRLALATAALNFVVSIFLVQKMGLMGVIWGTSVEQSLWGLVIWPLMAKHIGGLPLKRYLRVIFVETILPFTLASLPLGLLLRGHCNSYLILAGSATAVAVCAGVACWLVVLTREERESLRTRLRLGA